MGSRAETECGDVQAYQMLNYPGEGLFPTLAWGPGMLLVDRYQLKLPAPDAAPYLATVALFDNVSGEMLPAQAADGQALPESTFNIPPPLN